MGKYIKVNHKLIALFSRALRERWLPSELLSAAKDSSIEIVRCKNCKYYDSGWCTFMHEYGKEHPALPKHYCTWGIPKVMDE